MTISAKWPAVRLLGPDVSVENALEFIRRTDDAFGYGGYCNDRRFEEALKRLIGLEGAEWPARQRFMDAFGYVELGHLGSEWIACSWVGGPNGLVSQSGRVSLAKNFGKWPSTEEVEQDLTKVAEAFPGLAFELGVWGHLEEGDDGLPSDMWSLKDGAWERIDPAERRWPPAPDFAHFMSGLMRGQLQETTWTVPQIEKMWGSKIAAAREIALAAPAQGEP